MKIIKPRYDLIFIFFFIFSSLALSIYFLCLKPIASFYFVNWVFDAVLFFILFFGSFRLGMKRRFSTRNWLCILFTCQFLLTSIIAYLPYTLQMTNLSLAHIFEMSLHGGVFPFGFLAIFALSLGYFTYSKKSFGLFSSTFTPLFANTNLDSIGIVVDSYMRLVPLLCLAFSLLMVVINTLILASRLIPYQMNVGLNLNLILTSSLLLSLANRPKLIKLLHQIEKRSSLLCATLLSTVFVAIAFPLFTIMIHWLLNTTLTSSVIVKPNTQNRDLHLLALLTFWWLGFSMLAGGIIAWASEGRSFREIILGMLGTHLLSWVVVLILDKSVRYFNHFPMIFLIICHLAIICILLKRQNFTYFMRGTLPSTSALKSRSSFRFLTFIPIIVVSAVSAYLALGIYFLSFDAIVGFFPCVMITLIGYIGFVKVVVKRDTVSNFSVPD